MTNYEVTGKIKEAFEKYCKEAGLTPYRDIGLGFDNEMRQWGRASWKEGGDDEENFIEINLKMMLRMPEEIEDTVAHEVAHVASRDHHGSRWAEMVRKFGFDPIVTKHFNSFRKPVWA